MKIRRENYFEVGRKPAEVPERKKESVLAEITKYVGIGLGIGLAVSGIVYGAICLVDYFQ